MHAGAVSEDPRTIDLVLEQRKGESSMEQPGFSKRPMRGVLERMCLGERVSLPVLHLLGGLKHGPQLLRAEVINVDEMVPAYRGDMH